MLGILAGASLRSLLLAAAVGAALRLRRISNPRVSLAAWSLVLAGSLSMPLATQLIFITLPQGMIQVATLPMTQEIATQANVASVLSRAQQGVSAILAVAPNWYRLVSFLYLAVLSLLLARLLLGLLLSWRIVRRATPIREDWVDRFDVRVSRQIDAPATFGSVILLPCDYTAWPTAKRLAVLAHEGAHVARWDSTIQLAAAINRVVFWFNPFTWWLQRHLSDLAEAASDAVAIASLNDRFAYAEILLEFSGRVARLPNGIAMARRPAVGLRIDRILSDTPLPASISQRGRALVAACVVPLVVLLSSTIISSALPPGKEIPSAANTAEDETTATGAKRSAPAYLLAIVMPKMAISPAVKTEVVAPELPHARELEATVSPRPTAMPPERLSVAPLRTTTVGQSRLPLHSLNTKKVAASTSRQAVALPKALLPITTEKDQATKVTEEGPPPFFESLINETCGVTDVLRLGPASVNLVSGPSYLAKAHFFRSPDGKPWVTLFYTGGQAATLPVMIREHEIEFTRSYNMIYTLSPSRNNHVVSFAKRPAAGTVDFACSGGNDHSL